MKARTASETAEAPAAPPHGDEREMIISHRKQFILFAPWKTASSSVRARLKRLNDSPYDRFYAFNPHLNRVVHQHLTCAEFCCLPESRLDYFKASFVRNPYDRVYSGFQQLQTQVLHQPTVELRQPWVRALVAEQIADLFAQLSRSGFDFDRWVGLLSEHQIYEVGRNTSLPLHPAHYWTHLNGSQFVDRIGKVETFEEDFDALCARLDLSDIERVNKNVSSGDDIAPDSSGPYRYVDRMSRTSIDKINALFKADFELFDYKVL